MPFVENSGGASGSGTLAQVLAAGNSASSTKITNLANGSSAQDAAAFGQIPTALPPNGAASGELSGTYPSPTVVVGAGGVPLGRAVISGVTQYSLPGITPLSTTTFPLSQNRAMYFPFLVQTPITIDQIVFELTTGQAASTCRAAIYGADTSWQPTSLVANTDTGALATAVANQGVIATTITATALSAGRYLFWLNASAASIVFRAILGGSPFHLGYAVALGANPGWSQIFIAQAYGAPPSTGLAWTGSSTSGVQSFTWPVFVRVSTP